MNLAVTIAVGDRFYGDCALNWCLSVKASDPHQHTVLIYSPSAIKGIEPLVKQHFQYRIAITTSEVKNPLQEAYKTKVNIYDYMRRFVATAERVIYMDADSVMLPGQRLSDWFKELEGEHIAFYTENVLNTDSGVKTMQGRTFACDVQNAREYFEIKKFIPQICTTWMYWKFDPVSWLVFTDAQKIYSDNKFGYTKSKGVSVPDFSIAMSLAKNAVWPCSVNQTSYYPVFLEPLDKTAGNKELMAREYRALGFTGVESPDKNLVNSYTQLVNYYRQHSNPDVKFVYDKKNLRAVAEMPIKGFWHVCMINDYVAVVTEQLSLMVKSGLYSQCEHIYVGCVGPEENLESLRNIFAAYSKIEIAVARTDIGEFEFPTLKVMHARAQMEEFYAFYIHTKGVSDKRGKHWRDYMNYYNITKWNECVQKLRSGYDIVGVKWMNDSRTAPRHFSGNFYHAQSRYLRKLPNIDLLDTKNRYMAEFWHGMRAPKYYSLSQKMIDHCNLEPFI